MTATICTPAPGASLLDPAPETRSPIVVATDGTSSGEAALRATAMLAARSGAPIIALAVLPPLPLMTGDYGIILPPPEMEQARRDGLLESVRHQAQQAATVGDEWRVEMRDGDPATVIARFASEIDASLVVLGIGHHNLTDRLFGGETALHALRRSRVPVLAVAQSFSRLPARAVIATDFSAASIHAARQALELFDSLSMVFLVHVAPKMESHPEAFAIWMSSYGENVGSAFSRLRAELGVAPRVTVETITLQGRTSKELLSFAKSVQADLIVTGSRGAGLIDRILVGSTATGLIRGASTSVFAVPAVLADELMITHDAATREPVDAARWATELQAFTKRNVGRRATLEIDDPALGAQTQLRDYPLLGTAYDHHDRQVEIMLGDLYGTQRHVSRGISDIRGIELLRDADGRDRVLCIAHGTGQTILTLVR